MQLVCHSAEWSNECISMCRNLHKSWPIVQAGMVQYGLGLGIIKVCGGEVAPVFCCKIPTRLCTYVQIWMNLQKILQMWDKLKLQMWMILQKPLLEYTILADEHDLAQASAAGIQCRIRQYTYACIYMYISIYIYICNSTCMYIYIYVFM